jgi:hypothetical protein
MKDRLKANLFRRTNLIMLTNNRETSWKLSQWNIIWSNRREWAQPNSIICLKSIARRIKFNLKENRKTAQWLTLRSPLEEDAGLLVKHATLKITNHKCKLRKTLEVRARKNRTRVSQVLGESKFIWKLSHKKVSSLYK